MNNIEAVDRFDQTSGVKIAKLFWIAGSLENSDLNEMLEEMEDDDFKKCFPEIFNSNNYEEYHNEGEFIQALINFNKFGLLAEIHLPECKNFKFENGKDHPVSWNVHKGICRIEYCYAETLEDLMSEIEKTSEKVFKHYIEQEISKK